MLILDRYEGDFAFAEENGVIKKLPRNMLEKGIPEGSVLMLCGNIYKEDKKATFERRKKIARLQDSLFE